MINFDRLDRSELEKIGIVFKNDTDANLFIVSVMDDLEYRVGSAITRKLTATQIEDFDNISKDKAKEWLEKNVPN